MGNNMDKNSVIDLAGEEIAKEQLCELLTETTPMTKLEVDTEAVKDRFYRIVGDYSSFVDPHLQFLYEVLRDWFYSQDKE